MCCKVPQEQADIVAPSVVHPKVCMCIRSVCINRVARIAVKKVCNLHRRQEGPLGQNFLMAIRLMHSSECTTFGKNISTWTTIEEGIVRGACELGTYCSLARKPSVIPSLSQQCFVFYHTSLSTAKIDSERHKMADANDDG